MALRIKELRKNKKMSQKDLADVLNMRRENISNYERGTITNIPSDVLEKLSNFFDVSVDYLLGKTDNPKLIKADPSMAKQVMMRMDTADLSEKEKNEIESEMERFFAWRLEEIKKERENTK